MSTGASGKYRTFTRGDTGPGAPKPAVERTTPRGGKTFSPGTPGAKVGSSVGSGSTQATVTAASGDQPTRLPEPVTPQNQVSAGQGLPPGVFRGNKGEQVVVTQGRAPQTAGRLVRDLQGRTFEPARLQRPPQLRDKVVGINTGGTINTGADRVIVEQDGRKNVINEVRLRETQNDRLQTLRTGISTVPDGRSLPVARIPGVQEAKIGFGKLGEAIDQVGTQYKNFSPAGKVIFFQTKVLADARQAPAKLEAANKRVSEAITFVGENYAEFNPLVRAGIAPIKNIYQTSEAIQFVGDKIADTGEAIITLQSNVNNPLLREGIRTAVPGEGLAYFGGVMERTGERIVSKPVTTAVEAATFYGVGKVFGIGLEGAQYLATRGAAAGASEGLLIRTSTAGISKGLQAAPTVAGAFIIGAEGTEIISNPSKRAAGRDFADEAPALVGFITGDLAARGIAQRGLKELSVRISGAKELPVTSIAEPSVIKFFAEGPNAPGAQKFSVIDPAGDLAANKAAFFKARNPETGQFDIITGTQSVFAPQTVVLRGTSRQGGLYVAPTGQAQIYFTGIGEKAGYELGIAKAGEPNLVRIKNIERYSEELIPLFKVEGQGNTRLSDAFLREKGSGKTVYVESRTFFKETPEVQAVLPEGTPLVQVGLQGPLQKFVGFNEFIRVGKEIIPVRVFDALPKPGGQSTSAGAVKKVLLESDSGKYLRTVDPVRGSVSLASVKTSLLSDGLVSAEPLPIIAEPAPSGKTTIEAGEYTLELQPVGRYSRGTVRTSDGRQIPVSSSLLNQRRYSSLKPSSGSTIPSRSSSIITSDTSTSLEPSTSTSILASPSTSPGSSRSSTTSLIRSLIGGSSRTSIIGGSSRTPPPPPPSSKGQRTIITGEKRSLLVQAFDLLVREKGKDQRIASDLTKTEALALGANIVRSNLSAQFAVEESGKLIKDRKKVPVDLTGFRNFKIVNRERIPLKDRYIQIASRRLDSRRERSQIQRARKDSRRRGRSSWL